MAQCMPEDTKGQPVTDARTVTHCGLYKSWHCEALSWTSSRCLCLPTRVLCGFWVWKGVSHSCTEGRHCHCHQTLEANALPWKYHLSSQTVEHLNPICACHLLSDLGKKITLGLPSSLSLLIKLGRLSSTKVGNLRGGNKMRKCLAYSLGHCTALFSLSTNACRFCCKQNHWLARSGS